MELVLYMFGGRPGNFMLLGLLLLASACADSPAPERPIPNPAQPSPLQILASRCTETGGRWHAVLMNCRCSIKQIFTPNGCQSVPLSTWALKCSEKGFSRLAHDELKKCLSPLYETRSFKLFVNTTDTSVENTSRLASALDKVPLHLTQDIAALLDSTRTLYSVTASDTTEASFARLWQPDLDYALPQAFHDGFLPISQPAFNFS